VGGRRGGGWAPEGVGWSVSKRVEARSGRKAGRRIYLCSVECDKLGGLKSRGQQYRSWRGVQTGGRMLIGGGADL